MSTTTVSPTIICPPWCTVTQAEHVSALKDWEGAALHYSSVRYYGDEPAAMLMSASYPDGTPTHDGAVTLELRQTLDLPDEGLSPDDAEALAHALLAAVEEARR